MDPLQHLVAPRRPSLSPRSKARNGGARNVFALPVIHQFEPVLASSPKSYMVGNASKKHKDGDVGTMGSPSMVPSQPQRPKSKDGVESPRALRPQPPAGISSRTDVDIYRYSQATEQRLAIRPLFEQRRGSEDGRLASAKRKVKKKKKTGVVVAGEDDGSEVGGVSGGNVADDCDDKSEMLGETLADASGGESNQEDVRTPSPTPEDCVGSAVGDDEDTRRRETEDEEAGDVERLHAGENAEPSLLKRLDISSCYEPFLQTEGPKLAWLRAVIETASPASTTATLGRSPSDRPPKADMLVYKTLAKDLQELGGRSVRITLLLSSRGDAHVSCTVDGGEEAIVAISSSDLEQSKRLRRDLQVLTPTWAAWMITRARCDSRWRFFVDLTDAEGSEQRVCFSDRIQVAGKEVSVEMVALTSANSLLISVKEAASTAAEILLRPDDLRRLAVSLGEWSDEGDADQEVSTLFDDRNFLRQLVTESNVVRVGMNCAGLADAFDESLLTCPNPRLETVIDVPAVVSGVSPDLPSFVQEAADENKLVGTVALLVQAYVENGVLSTLRHFQQQEAIQLNVAATMQQAASIDSEAEFNDRVERNLEAARTSKLREIAIKAIVDDMVLELIAFECRVEIHAAKFSGGYDDHYASKVQATYRMSAQKKSYDRKRHVRMRAAQMLQALQRGIIARRRYSEMKVEREKYLFYGFRSSLYHATANMKDPRLRARELSAEAEQRRHAFLMQVIQGYVAENFVDDDFRVSAQLVRDVYNEYGVIVGCSTSFGEAVVSYLGQTPDQALYARVGSVAQASDPAQRLFSNSQVSAALLLGLRDQYDDTFGLSSSARRLKRGAMQRSRREALKGDSAPPRWMLKTCLSFQQANLDRLAGLRLTRKAAGRKSAHLVARDDRSVLASSFDSFESCRATWEAGIRARQQQQRVLDTFSVDELAQHCLDLLISCVKDWGLDPDPLFEALNLCGRHCHGKAAIRIVEHKFDAYASKMNELHGKQSVLTLREEIAQELEDFEKLLALRCLNMAVDDAVTVPTSELLHIMLKGNLDEEYLRHGLSTVLPIASITEKHDLARKMLYAYANSSYADAFNLICWSCLDVAENVTVEAARFLDKVTRPTAESDDVEARVIPESASLQPPKNPSSRASESLAARALYLFTGSQAVRFLQFLAKVAHFNKSIQKRVLALLAPYADKYEMHRLASAVCSLDDFSVVSKVFEACFSLDALRTCTPVWTQYKALFGEEKHSKAMDSATILASQQLQTLDS